VLIAVLMHNFVYYIFQIVCVPFAGKRHWPIAVER